MIRRRPSEVDALGAVVLGSLQESRDVDGLRGIQVLMGDDRASEPGEPGAEAVGEPLSVGLTVADHGHPQQVQLLRREISSGRALELVGG